MLRVRTRRETSGLLFGNVDEFEIGDDLGLDENETAELGEGHRVAGLRIDREDDLDVLLSGVFDVQHVATLAIAGEWRGQNRPTRR